MVIKRPKTYNVQKDDRISMTVDIRTFDILCRYVLSSSSYLRMNHLINLRKLVDGLNPASYENDAEKIKRVKFLKRALEARIDYNLNDIDMILDHIYSGIDFKPDFVDMNNLNMNADEVAWCHKMVSESLQYSFVYDETDELLDICTRIKSSDYSHRGELIKEFEGMVDKLKNEFRMSKTDDNLTDMTFSLKEGIFENVIKETYNLITNPSRRLICGMQGLNEMIGGGFESGRVYMLLGITGIGKSFALLNLVYQIKKYNRSYKTKDPTKTPCVVLLTMENTVVETITRLFDLAVTQSAGMENYTVDEVISKLREEGQLVLNDDSPIDIVIKYKANKSVDTSYLYALTDNLEDQGYEVICLIQDHVKRIRSIYGSTDIRLELGDIVNEFKVFAAEKDIPVITNCHLNRDAAKIIEEGNAKSSPTDITMKLGKSNVGESLLMMDNIDCAIIINLDFDEDNNKYMVFSLIKMRDKTDRTYIAQPFVYGSSIKMVEDVGGIPMFKEYLHQNHINNNRQSSIRASSTNVMSNINNIVSSNAPSNMNSAFSNIGMYSFETPVGVDEEPEEEMPKLVTKSPAIQPIFFMKEPTNKLNQSQLDNLKLMLQPSL